MGSASGAGTGIAVDGTNNVYITGESSATWRSPQNAHPGTGNWTAAFAAKLDSSGTIQWNTFMGSTQTDLSSAIAVDTTGNVYVAGTSYATWGSPLNAFTGGTNAFLVKLNSNGTQVWHTFIGSTSKVWGKAIALDSTDAPHLSGYSNVSWGSPINAHTGGGNDAYVAKLSTDGVLLWNTFMGSTDNDEGRAIAVDSTDNVFLAGDSMATWDSPVTPYTGSREAFVAMICASCYLVSTSAPAGQGSFIPETQTVDLGNTTTFDINAETGYEIDTVSGCGGIWTGSTPIRPDPSLMNVR
ncbi:MAG: SBBP repeat-containing protein [Proteobacteria bacterium]|nr:SBBP repeat-containing protein [Pseudomonadota bacterium]MBU1060104.1 SBBP repeat-containing protein [Pseudomonadota bacterium]